MNQNQTYFGKLPVHLLGDAVVEGGKFLFTMPERGVAMLRLWQKRYEARSELGALDERILKDVGLTREQALNEARKPIWRA